MSQILSSEPVHANSLRGKGFQPSLPLPCHIYLVVFHIFKLWSEERTETNMLFVFPMPDGWIQFSDSLNCQHCRIVKKKHQNHLF